MDSIRRRTLLVTGLGALATPTAAQADTPRRLKHRPPALVDPLVVDLTRFDPTRPFPGWTGREPSQSTSGLYPADRDLLVLGHRDATWSGGRFIRGGRNVHWLGGAYTGGPWLRNFHGDACFEGVLSRAAFDPAGAETGDAFSLNPDSATLARSRVSVLNCRAENVDGFFDGSHGDCFQLSSQHDPPRGYSACPREVVIERFTGTTGYQGLFLANQHFDAPENGYRYSCERLTLLDVNLRKTRASGRMRDGSARGSPSLIYMIDMAASKRGDRPYPKLFRRVFVEPMPGESIDDCIYPNRRNGGGVNPSTGTRLAPIVSPDGREAGYPPEMLLDGVIRLGPPPGGDVTRVADATGLGGPDRPGRRYMSPGYE